VLRLPRHELRAVGLAAALLFFVELSEAIAANAADALYLGAFGASGFGAVLAVSSLSLLVTLAAAGGLADRTERSALVTRLCLGGAVVLVLLRGLAFALPELAPAPLVVLSKQLAATVDLGVWVLLADRFDARQGRRLFPLLLAAGGVGAMAGSLATRALVEVVSASDLFLAAALALGLAAPFAAQLGSDAPLRQRKGPGTLLDAIPGSLEAARRSELARRLAIVVAAAGALGLLLHTALGAAAAAESSSPDALAAFFGRYRAGVGLIALVAQFTLGPFLLSRAGLAASLVVTPVVVAAGGWAMALRGDLLAAAIVQGAVRVLDAAVQTPAERVALNLLPRDLRGRAAALLEGVAKRGGALIGGLAATALVGLGVGLGGAVLVAGACWLAAAGGLARRFGRLAAAELAGRRGRRDDDSPLDDPTRRRLRRELSRGDDRQAALAAAVLAREAPGDAVVWLLEAAVAAPAARRAQLLDVLPRVIDPRGHAAAAVLFARRAELSAEERTHVVRAVGRLGPAPAALAEVAATDRSPAVRLAARLERLRLDGDLDARDRALDDATRPVRLARAERDAAAVALLAGLRGATSLAPGDAADPDEDPGGILTRATALAALAELAPEGRPATRTSLLALVENGDPDEQARALTALATAPADPATARAAAELLDRRAPEPVRVAAAELLGASGDHADLAALGRALADPEGEVRQAAADALVALGPRAAPVLLVAARHGRRRDAALDALAELPFDPATLDAWLLAEVAALETTIRRRAALEPLAAHAPGRLLLGRLGEREREVTEALLAVLEARHPGVGPVADRILFSNGRARARALEALDALLPRPVALRVLPLLDDLAAHARVADVPPLGEAAIAELSGDDRLARRFVSLAASEHPPLRAAVREAIRGWPRTEGLPELGVPRDEEDVPSTAETILALSRVPLFAELSPSQLGALAEACAWESHPAGAVVIGGGGEGESALYQVHSGELRIERGDAWDSVPAGGSLGERTLVLPDESLPRVLAGPKTRVVRLAPADFARVVDDHPQIGLAVARVLARRHI
jgi:ATP:ADP antiporter, AAA family